MNINIVDFLGINNVVTPFKLAPAFNQKFKNIDTTNYTLKSAKSYKLVGNASGPWYYKFPNWERWAQKPLSVEYHNGSVFHTSIGKDPSSVLKRWHNGTEYPVGLDAPTADINITDTGDWYRDENYYFAHYYYAITFYNMITDEESAPKISEVFGARRQTRIIIFDSAGFPPEATSIRVYRVGGFNDKFALLDTIPIGGGVVTITDTKPDTALTTLLTTSDNIKPPVGLCNLTKHNGRFYASKGSRLRFSDFGNAASWETLAFIDFESDITGLASINGLLLIYLDYKVFVLSGSSVHDYVLLTLTGDIGCKYPTSIAYIRNLVIWYTYNGIVCSDGNSVSFMTKDSYNFKDAIILDSAVWGDCYYMLTASTLYELDLAKGRESFRLYEVPAGATSLTVFERDLWCITPTEYFRVFGGSEDLEIEYRTKKFVGPLYLFNTEIKSIVVRFKGSFTLTVYDDNNIEIAKFKLASDLIKLEESFLLLRENTLTSIELELEGRGEIFSIGIDATAPQTYNYTEGDR